MCVCVCVSTGGGDGVCVFSAVEVMVCDVCV